MRQRRVGKVEPVPKRWLSKDEAMAYLGCSSKYLEKLRYNAQVSFAQDGRKVWYDLQSIDRFIMKNKIA